MSRHDLAEGHTARRLDVTTARTHPEPPGSVDAATDRSARILLDAGHTLFWLGMACGVVMVVQIVAVRGGAEPGGWLWPASWIGCVGGVVLGVVAVRVSERLRRRTGFPVPPELAGTATEAARAIQDMHELFDMVDASNVEPQWTEKVTKAMYKQLLVVGRQCELAQRDHRWHFTWMLPYRSRQTAKVSAPLHEATANVASGVLRGKPRDE